jgi:GTP cyclohydrolase IA
VGGGLPTADRSEAVGPVRGVHGGDLRRDGHAASSPSTADTPRRLLRAIFDATSGYEGDEKLVTAFPTECRGGPDCRISQVVEGPIAFFSMCEHHSLPFFGEAYVGYIAHEPILGLTA